MNGEATSRTVRHAMLDGGTGAFGTAIAIRLCTDGVIVTEDIALLPVGVPLNILITDLSTKSVDVPFRDVTDNDLRMLLNGQLYRFVAAVQGAVPRMTSGGSIVQIAPKAHLGAWGGVHVAASAAACVAMARSMAIELAPRGIRVNSVAVGRSGEAGDSQSGRADIAATVAWLAGPDSAQVTGETILADGGASLRMAQAARR